MQRNTVSIAGYRRPGRGTALLSLLLGAMLPVYGGPETVAEAPPSTVPAASREALLERHFLAIRDLDFKFGSVGAILEALVHVEMKKRFPAPRYEVLANVAYQDFQGKTRGELDTVVLDAETGKAILVGEVKLTRRLDYGHEAAAGQLMRFRLTVREGDLGRLVPHKHVTRLLKPKDFDSVKTFAIIGPRGALEAGYDYEIDITRDEADVVQKKILEYRRQRKERDEESK